MSKARGKFQVAFDDGDKEWIELEHGSRFVVIERPVKKVCLTAINRACVPSLTPACHIYFAEKSIGGGGQKKDEKEEKEGCSLRGQGHRGGEG